MQQSPSGVYYVSDTEGVQFNRDRFERSRKAGLSGDYSPRFPDRAAHPDPADRTVHHVSLVSLVPKHLGEQLISGFYGAIMAHPTVRQAYRDGQVRVLDIAHRHLTFGGMKPGVNAEDDRRIILETAAALPSTLLQLGPRLPQLDVIYTGYGLIGSKQASATIAEWDPVYRTMKIVYDEIPEMGGLGYKLDQSPLTQNGPPVQTTIAGFRAGIPMAELAEAIDPWVATETHRPFEVPWHVMGAHAIVHRHNVDGPNREPFVATEWLGYVQFGPSLEMLPQGNVEVPEYLRAGNMGMVVNSLDSFGQTVTARPMTTFGLENAFRLTARATGANEFAGNRLTRLTFAADAIRGFSIPGAQIFSTNAADALDRIRALEFQFELRGRAALCNERVVETVRRYVPDLDVNAPRLSDAGVRRLGEAMLDAELRSTSRDSVGIAAALDSVMSEQSMPELTTPARSLITPSAGQVMAG